MQINFPREEYLDGTADLIWFPAELNGRTIRCVIEIETLQACCSADLGDPVPTFHAHRPVIETAAAHRILAAAFEKDGSIVVTADDF